MRNRGISLYRSFLRATRNIPNPQARFETVQWLRDDFERARGVTDLVRRPAPARLGTPSRRRLLLLMLPRRTAKAA